MLTAIYTLGPHTEKLRLGSDTILGWFYIFYVSTTLVGPGILILQVSKSHSDTPHSVGFLRKCDRPFADNCGWLHRTLVTDKYPCLRRNSNPKPQETNDLIPRGLWVRFYFIFKSLYVHITTCLFSRSRQYYIGLVFRSYSFEIPVFYLWHCDPTRAMTSSFLSFLDHTQAHHSR